MAQPTSDPRNIVNGLEIPTESYSDQPYVVKTDDGAWLCVMTTGAGREGAAGQHVVALRSTDQGRTWSDPVPIEPADGPEASYAVMLKVPSGRVYAFYNHNTDNLREVIADDPPFTGGKCTRVDSLGYFVFKYSDDGGRTWSADRYPIPMRDFQIDRENPYGGKLKFFWNVGKPFVRQGAAFVSLHKVGGFGSGFFTRSEGVILMSPNMLTEHDPARIAWETLPDGEIGLRTPPSGGAVAEEQSYSVVSDGSIYAVYRTVDGHPACAISRDGARTWSVPDYQRFADGRPMKHPRAANFAWKCANGKFLYWFHNHGGCSYEDRNPVWLCGGLEADTPEGKTIRWTQPEIVLYDDDTFVRMSYPDLIEEDGRYFFTETQKDQARVHEVDPALLEGLWNQFDRAAVSADGLLLDLPGAAPMPAETDMPPLPIFIERDHTRADYGTRDLRRGFSLDLSLTPDPLDAGRILLDSRTPASQGLCLVTTNCGTLQIVLNDGRTENRWDCDPGLLVPGRPHHVAIIVDGGPRIISFIIDDRLCDGGEFRQFGWGRFSPNLRHANGAPVLRIAAPAVRALRLYDRPLRTSEAIAAFRAASP